MKGFTSGRPGDRVSRRKPRPGAAQFPEISGGMLAAWIEDRPLPAELAVETVDSSDLPGLAHEGAR
jgi:hypothetical protein